MKLFKLVGADGKPYESQTKGTLGGVRTTKLYGRLDCPSAKRALARGTAYAKNRVFFADEATAKAAGYRPCSRCLPKEYEAWKRAQAEAVASEALQRFSQSEFTIDDLADALSEGWRRSKDERDGAYYSKRREAFRRAFGLDAPTEANRYVELFLPSLFEVLAAPGNPFDGLMEAPELIIDLYREHGPALRAADEALKKEQRALLRALLSRVVKPDARVTGKELLAFGYDLAAKPVPQDPDDW